MKAFFIIACLFSASCNTENYLHLGMWSHHFEDGDYNEVHNLIGVEFDQYFLHRFKNSQGDATYFLGKMNRDEACYGNLCLGYSVGVMKGYKFKEYLPSVLGVISYERGGYGFDLSCFPSEVCALNFKLSDKAFDSFNINPIWKTKGYLEVALDHYDPDDPDRYGYSRNNGADYQLKLYANDSAFLKWGYTTTNSTIKPDQNDRKFPAAWKTGNPSRLLSKGYFMAGKDFDSFTLGVSYNQVTIQENILDITKTGSPLLELPKKRYNGFGIHISKDYSLSDKTTLRAELAVIDTLITDSRLTFEVRHQISENSEITLRTIDYEKWNSSHYQLGYRYHFNN